MDFDLGAARVTVNIADLEQLNREVGGRLRSRRGFALATLNLDHMAKLRRDAEFARAYAAQDFVTADGNPVVWLARLAGRPLNLLPGSDLIEPLCRLAAEARCRIALVGSGDATLRAAAERLGARIPGLEVALCIAPPLGFDPDGSEAEELLCSLEAWEIGLAFLAFGAPKQERLAARGRHLAPSVGFASIGAGLDFIAGTQRRAPRLLRRLALEWLWRLAREPRRLGRRYLDSAAVLPGQVRSALNQGRNRD